MTTQTRLLRNATPGSISQKVSSALDRWNINFISRRQLLELSDEQLRDIGIDRVSALQEGSKPFWRK